MKTYLLWILAGMSAGAVAFAQTGQTSTASDPGATGDATGGSVNTTVITTEVTTGDPLGAGAAANATGARSSSTVDPIGPFRSSGALGGDAGATTPVSGTASPSSGAISPSTGPLTPGTGAISPAGSTGAVSPSTSPVGGGTSTLSPAPSGTSVRTRRVAPGVSPGTDPIGPTTTITTTSTQRPPGVSPQPDTTGPDRVSDGSSTRTRGARPIGETSVSRTVVPSTPQADVPPASTLQTASAPTGVAVATPPPAAPNEIRPAAPGPDYVWVRGHYELNQGVWSWTNGRWELPPQPGMVWVDSRFEPQTQRWTPGYWSTPTPTPTGR